ncbi:enoyl-CoA hydratase-related protein [Variovorax sp. J22P168]|uniref:enoyl-CoA hydratase-related protein n=1 Tax=Variovorax jilinensis TaxID=3053513 RepID=UPI002575D680|nr:enoyl-CoA hydratase-related protein [Variovorax sp. J22P168]MDM0015113.1 enoyl-CoA hydratase-related protein [Variovorax sp. J22P168]
MSEPVDVNPGVRLERPEPTIALLRLDRAEKMNALGDDTVAAIGRLLDAVSSDPAVRVLVITGEGKGFCAGFDLGLATEAPGTAELGETAAWMLRQESFASLVTRLRAMRQPVIAAVNGSASGAGLGLALAAEIRIAGRSARFNAAFVRVGMSSCDIGVSWLLPRCVGLSRAFEIMLTGRMVDGVEAERIGLVSEVVDDALLMPRAMAIARAIAANSSFGVWMTKRGTWANVEAGSLQAAIELENRTQILTRTTGELDRAADGLLARRKQRGEGKT